MIKKCFTGKSKIVSMLYYCKKSKKFKICIYFSFEFQNYSEKKRKEMINSTC